jgi:hypothetical protein
VKQNGLFRRGLLILSANLLGAKALPGQVTSQSGAGNQHESIEGNSSWNKVARSLSSKVLRHLPVIILSEINESKASFKEK